MTKQYLPTFKTKIVLELLKEEKSLQEAAVQYGIRVNQLPQCRQRVVDELLGLFSREQQVSQSEVKQRDELIEKLYEQIGRLSAELSWLQKKMVTGLNVSQRRDLVEWAGGEFSVSTQAKLLGLHRSGLYYPTRQPSAREVALKHRIDEIYTATPFYGARKIAAQLQQEGYDSCRETGHRYMQEMGLQVIYPQPNLSQRRLEDKVYPYLLKHIAASYPHHIWGIDITYISLGYCIPAEVYLTSTLLSDLKATLLNC